MVKKALLLLLVFSNPIGANNHPISFLYAHGLGDSNTEAYRFSRFNRNGIFNKNALITTGRIFTFDFPDVTKRFWRVNVTQTSLAQANEIITLQRAYQQAMATLKMEGGGTDLILMGLSRGAATIINFMGIYNPHNVKAIILESPFDHMATVVQNKLQQFKLDSIPGIKTISDWIVSSIFMKHKINGIAPIQCAGAINPLIPILLVCSKEDTLVPYHSTVALYNSLRANGHQHAYLLVLERGKHAFALSGADGDMYAATVHAFYKKYNLPYDEKLANRGQSLLEQCQKT